MSADFSFLTLRKLTAYQADGARVPQNYILQTSTNGVAGFTNTLTISSVNTSTLNASTLNAPTAILSAAYISTLYPSTIIDDSGSRGTTGQLLSAGPGGNVRWISPGGGSGGVDTVNSGYNILVNNSDPANPIINLVSTLNVSTVTASTISSVRILDGAGGPGTLGQILVSGGSNVTWSTINIGASIPNGVSNSDYLFYSTGTGWTVGSTKVRIGYVAGVSNQLDNTVAIGSQAGQTDQQATAIAIGYQAGRSQQQNSAIAIGQDSGETTQETYAIAIGNLAGNTSQSTTSIALGYQAARNSQGANAIAIGTEAGEVQQDQNSIAIGNLAGSGFQKQYAVAIGYQAGFSNQSTSAIAIGGGAGQTNQSTNAIAIGASAGSSYQADAAIAIGGGAGTNFQSINSIAIGNNAGNQYQLDNAVAIGYLSGRTNQSTSAIAIGDAAGYEYQGQNAIAIGNRAGYSYQSTNTIVLNASGTALNTTSTNALYIKPIRNESVNTNNILQYNTGTNEITYTGPSNVLTVSTITTSTISSLTILDKDGASGSLGQYLVSGGNNVKWSTISAGGGGGTVNSVVGGVNITVNSASATDPIVNLNSTITLSTITTSTIKSSRILDQNNTTGSSDQVLTTNGSSEVFWTKPTWANPAATLWGQYAYYNGTNWAVGGENFVRFGQDAGKYNQDSAAIALGYQAGSYYQGERSIAIGFNAAGGLSATLGLGQGKNAIAIGGESGGFGAAEVPPLTPANNGVQGDGAIAIGTRAGYVWQGISSIAIGSSAGYSTQQTNAIAIGAWAGRLYQSTNSIAIGTNAGQNNQSSFAIALGYAAGQNNQATNTIVINASTIALNTTTSNSLYIAPIRSATATGALQYDTTTKEVTYDAGKTFVIDHPKHNDRYLVHACLEGPEDGIYYRGKAEITENNSTIVNLPDYVDALGSDFTVQITPIFNGSVANYATSEVECGKFTVYGPNGKFFWLVNGKRSTFNIEPLKSSAQLMGNGPYKWLQYI